MEPLEILPLELWEIIYEFLPPMEKYYFSLVCRDFIPFLEEDKKITLFLHKDLNDKQLQFFGNCNFVVINTEDLTGEQLKFFSNVENLDIQHCATLEPEDILQASLTCTFLSLYGEACLGLGEELIQLTKLELVDSPGTEEELKGLTNLEELNLTGCDNFTGDYIVNLPKLKKLELFSCSRFTQENMFKLAYLTEIKVTNCSEINTLPWGPRGCLIKSPQLTSTNNSYMHYHIAPYSEEAETLPFIGL